MPQLMEIDSCDKLFITPDSTTWNPYCDSFAKNEESLVNFQGEISEPSRHQHYLMESDDMSSSMFELSSVSVNDWNEAISAVTENAFVADTQLYDRLVDDVSTLANSLELITEISKFTSSIGSTSI